MTLRNTMLILIVSMMTACQHERPESPPEKKGSLPDDFFLVGEYVCYKRVNIDTQTQYYYDNSDSMTVTITQVVNGFSTVNWRHKDTLLHSATISDYGIPQAYNAYKYPLLATSNIECRNNFGHQLAAFKCWPNNINYGYITDSIIDISYKFGNGPAYLYKMP